MGYAEIYRKRMSKGRRALRAFIYIVVAGGLLYLSILTLTSQSGLMFGGAAGGSGSSRDIQEVKKK